MIDNKGFLTTIFGDDAQFAHVTDFADDPLAIPQDRRAICWAGDYARNYQFRGTHTNQYFCISIFKPDDHHKARRRIDLFLRCPVIVLDDVREKLTMVEVSKLPKPTYILETSPGSEQWGYVLDTPCQVRDVVDNLLDGLVANGLAPGGTDPGMKGVTRYVRLPDGYNTKKSKMVDGQPFKCRLVSWEPEKKVTIAQLAAPFGVDLYATRQMATNSHSAEVLDHPFLNVGLVVKATKGPGKYDITCPWLDEHTDGTDDGCVMWTNEDGSPGFQCHHGHCQDRTANDVIKLLELRRPGFEREYNDWLVQHRFRDVLSLTPTKNVSETVEDEESNIDKVLNKLRKMGPNTDVARKTVSEVLQLVDKLSEIEKQHYHTEICDMMHWTKANFAKILKDLRNTWYEKEVSDFYKDIIYVKEMDRFYDRRARYFMTPAGFQNSFSHEDKAVKEEALVNGRVQKVDKLDFAPKQPPIFTKDNIVYSNTWVQTEERLGTPGDCSIWLRHWDILGWGDHRKHCLQWMAYTLLHPEEKINHILVFGGAEGIGKDMLLHPFKKAMGIHQEDIDGSALLSDFNEYLFNNKYININETELGNHKDSTSIRNKIKPLGAAPPDKLMVNEKQKSRISISNIVNVTITTNSNMPFRLSGATRRYYAMWSDLVVRDTNNQNTPEWETYFTQSWDWMYTESAIDHCIYYLRNHVDLSDFKPKTPPPVTEFLQDIQDSSKSPGHQTIEAFMANNIGVFADDIITATTASETLRSGLVVNAKFMYAQGTWFTPQKVGAILKDIPGCVQLRAKGDEDLRVWVIRDKEKYERMNGKELYQRFKNQ